MPGPIREGEPSTLETASRVSSVKDAIGKIAQGVDRGGGALRIAAGEVSTAESIEIDPSGVPVFNLSLLGDEASFSTRLRIVDPVAARELERIAFEANFRRVWGD